MAGARMAGTIAGALRAGAGDAPAILAPGREPIAHGALRALVARLGGDLRAAGIGPRDRVAIVLPNGPEAAIAFLAAASHAIAAPLNPDYTETEFRFYLGDLGARALLTLPGEAAAAHAAAPPGAVRLALDGAGGDAAALRLAADGAPAARAGGADAGAPGPDDAALLLHTSGTTSRPKLVPLTQRNLAASAGNVAASLALTPADRCLGVMPLFHIHGLVAAVLAPLASGGSAACTPGFDAFRFFRWLDELAPTWCTAVPTMHQAILRRAARGGGAAAARGRLRFLRSSSAALPPAVMAELEAVFGAPLVEAYGMTEAAHQMTANPLPPALRKPGSVGIPAGAAIAILGEDGAPLPQGGTGEVAIRGEGVTPGYEANPEANAAAFADGWFRTGDEGRLDADGYLFLTGRLKEIINRGGEKISPREVDEALLAHEAIAQCVAFALPHPRLGEEVAAAVVPAEGAALTEREVREFAAQRLAPHKAPRRVVILGELPKGPTGKLQRIGLAERLGLA